MKDYKAAVFVGRFQPFHLGHLEVAQKGLEIADQLIFVLGSANAPASIKNPWSFDQRKEMILSCFAQDKGRVQVVGVRDYFYSDKTWVTDVKNKVGAFITPGDTVALIGNMKDDSSYYLKYFPEWETVTVRTSVPLDATVVREQLFKFGTLPKDYLPGPVQWHLENNYIPDQDAWKENPVATPISRALSERMLEFNAVQKNKETYGPGPFITTDAVVICQDHVLLVKRGGHPGRGLWALPGGFLRTNERIQTCAIRELCEETGIRLDKAVLAQNIKSSHVFDHPGRSLRGRTVTHAFYFELNLSELPEVKGNDDAAEAKWVSIIDINKMENEFYEDHAHIIQHFLRGQK